MKEFNSMDVRPYQLLCLICRQGRKNEEEAYFNDTRLDEIQNAIASDPIVPLTLRCNTETVYRYQNPGREEDTPEGAMYNDLRDLTVLQRLGTVPGSTRPAIDWFGRIPAAIPECRSVCRYDACDSPAWPSCRFAAGGNYERGLEKGVASLISWRTPAEMQAVKADSAAECLRAGRLKIRPHHLLCLACFHAGRARNELRAIKEDNAWECIDVMQRNPDVPVELIHGPCMLCPPCGAYYTVTNLCIGGNSMGLRDDKKDLDTLRRIGLKYGDVLPARELLKKVYGAIQTTPEICGHGDGVERSPEWRVCGGPSGNEGYVRARKTGLDVGVRLD